MASYDTKDIVNMAYSGVALSTIVFGYSMLAKKLLNMKTVDLNKLKAMDVLKFGGLITASSSTQDMLIKQGILPASIMK